MTDLRLTWIALLPLLNLAACKTSEPTEEVAAEEDTTDSDSTDDAAVDDGIDATTDKPFINEFDVGTMPTCDPFAQDCPDGEKCVPYNSSGETWDANKCVPVTGAGAAGDTCISGGSVEGTDDCGAESICWDVMDVDGELVGVCTPFCDGTADAPICEPGSSCIIANEGAINLCLPTCDPLLQDCGNGLACFFAVNDFNCIFTTDNIPTGEPCGYINDCASGNICLGPESFPACDGASCCGQFCDVTDGDFVCEPAGTECTSFYEEGMAPPGYDDVGVCVLPA